MIVKVNTQRIEIEDASLLVTGTRGVYNVEFRIDEDLNEIWKDVTVLTACFKKWRKDTVVSVVLTDNQCAIPAEMLVDTDGFQIGLYGSTATVDYNTVWSERMAPDKGCTVGASPVTPTPSIWNQIVTLVQNAEAAAVSASTAATEANVSAAAARSDADDAAESAEEAVDTANEAVETANEAKALVEDLTATATTLSAGSPASVTVTTLDEHYNLAFGIPQGDTGATGQAAGFGVPTATIDANTGTPSVTITATGPDTAKVFSFDFKNLKGQKGDPGTGIGDMLQSDYDANSVVKNAGGIPSYVENHSVPAGGTTGQALVKRSNTDRDVEWNTIAGNQVAVQTTEPTDPDVVLWIDSDASGSSIDPNPTSGSSNAVSSGGVYTALQSKQDALTFDDTPTSGSNNPVKSSGIYTALGTKQDTLTFDDTPTSGSNNPVKSSGIYTALQGKQNTITSSTDLTVKTLTGGVTYLTEAPTADNTDGLKIVYLSAEPSTKYNGYLYLIAES